TIGNDYASGVDASVARKAFQNFAVFKKLFRLRLGFNCAFKFQILFRGGLKRDTDLVRDHPRDAISVAIAQAHDAADVADNAFCLQLSKGDDLRDAPLAVFLSHVSEDFAAASLTKIDIDVGRRDAIGIEEALKQKPELERIDVS